jgi:hypothetical protein
MTTRIVVLLAFVSGSTGCLAALAADSAQKGVQESNRHKEREKELELKEKELAQKKPDAG